MIDPILHYAFIDESGTVGVPNGTHFLVVAVLTSTQPRDLELPVRRALKKYGRSLTQGEIKATHASEKMNLRMLEAIAGRDVSIVLSLSTNRQLRARPMTWKRFTEMQ